MHLKKCCYYQDSQSLVGVTPPSAVVGSKRSRCPDDMDCEAPPGKRFSLPRTPPSPVLGRKRARSSVNFRDDEQPSPKRVVRSLTLPSVAIKTGNSTALSVPNKSIPRQFSREEKWKIERALVELHADNHLADRFIEQPSTRFFLELLCPGISSILPSRRVLGGRLLDDHAKRCYAKAAAALLKMQEIGGRVNLVSDVWQNVCKELLTGCLLTLFGQSLSYSLTDAGDQHHGIAIAGQLEVVLLRAQSEGWDVGGIITDDAGQCRRARQILILRWPKIAFLFCFAHDINNLVKEVLKTSFSQITREAASAVNALNSSSSKWLKRARNLMVKMYGYKLSLCSLCVTRWNSMQACFASLLRVKSSLQMLARQSCRDDEFPVALSVFLKDHFWDDLKRAERVIAPLSLSSYRLQRDENTVGDVVKSFGDIYLGFKQAPQHSSRLVECVERRWKKCEQPLMMLGYALHPAYAVEARKMASTSVSSAGVQCKFAVYYYRRFIDSEFGLLRRDMYRWMKGSLTLATAEEFDGSPSEYWQYMAAEHPDSKLPDLALKILSIAVNSATCERLFSELGLIQTPKRSRMKVLKVPSNEIVAKHVRQRAQKSTSNDPFTKRILSPDERQILYADPEEADSLTPPSVTTRPATAPLEGDDNLDDPGDLAEPKETLELWEEFLDEVFQDMELGAEYAATNTSPDTNTQTAVNELEAIAEPDRTPFPKENQPDFPHETTVKGIRSLKATLAELFG